MNHDSGNASSFFVGMLAGFLLGMIIGNWVTNCAWKDICIERNHAQYDSKTGDWQWIDNNERIQRGE